MGNPGLSAFIAEISLFVLAAGVALLFLMGIRNAWDVVT